MKCNFFNTSSLCSLLLSLSLCAQGATLTTRVTGETFHQSGIKGHTWTITKGSAPPSTTVWVDEYRNGTLYSHNTLWMQTDGSGNLSYNLDLGSGLFSGTGSGVSKFFNTVNAVYKNRDTGAVIFSITDVTDYDVVGGVLDNVDAATMDAQTFSMTGAPPPQNKLAITLGVKGNGVKAHTLTLKRKSAADGAETTVGTASVPVGGAYNTPLTPTVDWNFGDKLETFVDGKMVDSFDPTLAGFPTEQLGTTTPFNVGSMTFDDKAVATPTQDVSTTQTNEPDTTTTSVGPDGTPRINTQVKNGGTTISGGTTGATTQDIYNAVKAADKDAANESSGASAVGTFDAGGNITGTAGTEAADALTAVEGAKSQIGSLKAALDGLGDHVTGVHLPGSSGKVWNYTTTLPIMGTMTLDWLPYADYINLLRAVCLACMILLFWWLNARMIKGAF